MRDEFATTPYKKGGYGSATIIVSNSPARFPPTGAGLDTRPAKRLPSRDAPEFAPLNGCDADGSLSRQRIAVGSFFVRMASLGVATHDGSDPKSARPTHLVVIAMPDSRSARCFSDTFFGYAHKLTLRVSYPGRVDYLRRKKESR
jgi:hypothetical protein